MDYLNLGMAIVLPWLFGITTLRLIWKQYSPSKICWLSLIGYGYFLGIFATTLLIRAFDGFWDSINFYSIILALLLLVLLNIKLGKNISNPIVTKKNNIQQWKDISNWEKILFGILFSLIVFRILGLTLEIILRPIFPWDAWSSWAVKARVWFEYKSIIDFIPPWIWAEELPDNVYTAFGTDNPIAVSLIQTWISLSIDRWDDSLINIPWIFCGIAFGLAFYSQLRRYEMSPGLSLLLTYLLSSAPILNTHIALAGYADIWITAVYTLAVMSFFKWMRFHDTCEGIVSVLFILLMLLVKETGLILIFPFFIAFYYYLIPFRYFILTLSLCSIFLVVIFFFTGLDVTLPGVGRVLIYNQSLVLPYSVRFTGTQPVLIPLIENLFVLSNWNIFWWFFAASLFFVTPLLKEKSFSSTALLIFSSFIIFILLFALTRLSESIIDATYINRIILNFYPGSLFFVAIVIKERFYSSKVEAYSNV